MRIGLPRSGLVVVVDSNNGPSGVAKFLPLCRKRASHTVGRGGTAEVEVHRRDRILLQFAGGAHQRRNIVPDHLRDGRTAGRPASIRAKRGRSRGGRWQGCISKS